VGATLGEGGASNGDGPYLAVEDRDAAAMALVVW
jgi:hypothetical protein